MSKDTKEPRKVLYMHSFDLKVIEFCRDNDYWKEGTFDDRLNHVIEKGMEAVIVERSL